jgi:hypothetical protein
LRSANGELSQAENSSSNAFRSGELGRFLDLKGRAKSSGTSGAYALRRPRYGARMQTVRGNALDRGVLFPGESRRVGTIILGALRSTGLSSALGLRPRRSRVDSDQAFRRRTLLGLAELELLDRAAKPLTVKDSTV